jgi:predicted GNAT family N-acyltransferase
MPGANYYKLSRLAVLKEYRQHRLGRELVLSLHDWVKGQAQQKGTLESVEIVCHSQVPVKGFYAKYVLVCVSLRNKHVDSGHFVSVPRFGYEPVVSSVPFASLRNEFEIWDLPIGC